MNILDWDRRSNNTFSKLTSNCTDIKRTGRSVTVSSVGYRWRPLLVLEQNSWAFGLKRMLAGYLLGDGPAWMGIEPLDEVAGLGAELARRPTATGRQPGLRRRRREKAAQGAGEFVGCLGGATGGGG